MSFVKGCFVEVLFFVEVFMSEGRLGCYIGVVYRGMGWYIGFEIDFIIFWKLLGVIGESFVYLLFC